MAERTVMFYVGVDSVTPETPQYAGVQGDHNVTDLTFVLDQGLISADYLYRLEFIDGMNTFDTTDFLTVSSSGTITVPLIRSWTKAGGAGEARLVISKLNEAMSEELILYTLVGHVYFESKDGCDEQEDDAVRGLTTLIVGVRQAQSSAYQSSVHANLAAERVEDAVSLADSAMSLANTAAANASNAALDARHAATDILNKAVSGEFDGHGLSVLGLYGTLADLQAAHPSGSPGDAYAVGTAAANDLFVWNAGESSWQNVGNILGGWTMNDLCIDGGDWTSGTGGWMMDSLCMDAGDWSGTGTVDTLSEHEVDPNTHENLMIDGSIL